jgi:hypothetical protein
MLVRTVVYGLLAALVYDWIMLCWSLPQQVGLVQANASIALALPGALTFAAVVSGSVPARVELNAKGVASSNQDIAGRFACHESAPSIRWIGAVRKQPVLSIVVRKPSGRTRRVTIGISRQVDLQRLAEALAQVA